MKKKPHTKVTKGTKNKDAVSAPFVIQKALIELQAALDQAWAKSMTAAAACAMPGYSRLHRRFLRMHDTLVGLANEVSVTNSKGMPS